MTRIIAFPLGDSEQNVLVEIADEQLEHGAAEVAAQQGVVQVARQTFEAAITHVKPIIKALAEQVGALDIRPTEVEVEFGLKMTTATGVIIASSEAECNFKVALKWGHK